MAWEPMSQVKIESVAELEMLSSASSRRLKGLPS